MENKIIHSQTKQIFKEKEVQKSPSSVNKVGAYIWVKIHKNF
jgi:hypothetical protein